jgi:enamine deaminase RidA (YjgF/YER057c/UK114 family)
LHTGSHIAPADLIEPWLQQLPQHLRRELADPPADTLHDQGEGNWMSGIRRLGNSHRWSDVVIHRGVARWVEVAADITADARSQVAQVMQQIDDTLVQIGSSKQDLLQIQIFLANLAEVSILNEVWDSWVQSGHAPIRACVEAGLGTGCRVEMIITAAAPE